jgi:hypothetical protein
MEPWGSPRALPQNPSFEALEYHEESEKREKLRCPFWPPSGQGFLQIFQGPEGGEVSEGAWTVGSSGAASGLDSTSG